MQNEFAIAAHWSGEFDEDQFQTWCESLRAKLQAPSVSLGLVFASSRYFDLAEQVLEIVRVHARVPLLAGCSSDSLIANGREIEDNAGIVVALYHLPGAELKAVRFTADQLADANGPAYWHSTSGVAPSETNGWLAFADPFHLDCAAWLRSWSESYRHRPIVGGLASGNHEDRRTQIYLDGEVFESGGVAVSIGGDVELQSVISQGCTPIGETWTITETEENVIRRIGNQPAAQVLIDTFESLSEEDRRKTHQNLFVGLVINEYREEFQRGDFLVHNLMDLRPAEGEIVVSALPREGQTLQFQRRDAEAATEDLVALLARAKAALAGRTVYGGVLHCCLGRGSRLFGESNHDAGLIQAALGGLPLSGFFCNGEIGPVGDDNFLHGYTASLALFIKKANGEFQPGDAAT
ncbi:MAG: small ligand-binding sensory domain FIST [Limisphaerales bacterium]|jgi:small ligand-binding sensory domain FIST